MIPSAFATLILPCGNHISHLCVEEDCEHSSPSCADPDCNKCGNRHSQCSLNSKLSFITPHLQKKIKAIHNLEDQINSLSDKFIKIIKVWAEQIKTTSKQVLLAKDQRDFMRFIEKRQFQKITSQLSKNIVNLQKQDFNSKLKKLKSNIQDEFSCLMFQIQPLLLQSKDKIPKIVFQPPKRNYIKASSLTSIDQDFQNSEVVFKSKMNTEPRLQKKISKQIENISFTSSIYFPKTEDEMVFDASINSDFFDVKDNGETISAVKNDIFNFAIVAPGTTLGSPFEKSFLIKRLQPSHSMYFGLCDLEKVKYQDYKCHLDQSSHSLLIKQSGEVFNYLQEKEKFKSKFTFKQGDTILIKNNWNGIIFKNTTTHVESEHFHLKFKKELHICFAIAYKGNQIKMVKH